MLAHSGNDKVTPQRYEAHVYNGINKAEETLVSLRHFLSPDNYQLLRSLVIGAFTVHDLGKLCHYSQKILNKEVINKKMPNHVDAGVAHLLQSKRRDDLLKAWIVKSHHLGYDNFSALEDELRDSKILSERCPWIPGSKKIRMREYTDKWLHILQQRHQSLVQVDIPNVDIQQNPSSLFMRLALSIHTHIDHFDTAKHYQSTVIEELVPLRAEERLHRLDAYVSSLSQQKHDPIKDQVYLACRNALITDSLVQCKSEVGTGKTTALMAFALSQCCQKGLRRVIYVAPFTNIISQTVDVYRKGLVLAGENELHIVAEHHHQVDYLEELKNREIDDEKACYLSKFTTDWHAPIICTTAVQFFETLAATNPSKLRKLHHLVGSVVIIDESHNCIPPYLWPMTLVWLKELTENLGCVVVFASGSMVLPWRNERIIQLTNCDENVPSIIDDDLSRRTLEREQKRVPIHYRDEAFRDPESVCKWVSSFIGSKIVVCNTIQNAAVIANTFRKKMGSDYVLHLSTSLTPADRERILEIARDRLRNRDQDWVMVATSCVEAGVDISFRYGFRENSSLMSAFQLAGRVSRNSEFFGRCELNVFELCSKSEHFNYHPAFITSREIFVYMYRKYQSELSPIHCSEAFDLELRRGIVDRNGGCDIKDMLEYDKKLKLKNVKEHYNVISDDKITVLIDSSVLSSDVTFTEIVRNSVQIYDGSLRDMLIKCQDDRYPYLWIWNGRYDPDFLGYMSHFCER